MKVRFAVCAGVFALLIPATNILAEDLNEIFDRTKKFVDGENYTKALQELQWAQKEIEKLHYKKLDSVFPAELGEFKGEKGVSQSAMGFVTFEKKYKKGENYDGVTLTYTGGGAADSGFAAFGRMAAAFGGNQPGVDSYRLQGRTATLNSQGAGNSSELSIFLDSGGVLRLEMSKDPSGEDLKKLAQGLELDKIESYLSGK